MWAREVPTMYWWLFLFPIAAFILFIGVMGVVGPRKKNLRARASASDLAAALGFEMLHGRDAVRRVIPGTSAESQAAMANYEKMPAILRNMFEASGKTMCLAGMSDGVRVTIFHESRGSGKSHTTFTVVRADYAKPLPFDLHIAHEGTLIRLGKALFGLRDLEVGDEAFDRAVRVKTDDAAAARAVLANPDARAAILGMIALSTETIATSAYAQWERQGRCYDPSTIRPVIAALVPVTRAFGQS
jgi:hypothetical protein